MLAPLVTVVIPAFNRAGSIGRAIRSVLAQTYGNLEIIVVDDCSTDDTLKEAEGFGDSRVRCIRHEKNLGGSAARNTGLKGARGEFTAFLDSDDEWFPEKLSRQVEVFGASGSLELGVVYTGWRWILEKEARTVNVMMPTARGDLFEALLFDDCVGSNSTPLIRTEVLKAVGGFDPDLPARQDWDLWLRLSTRCRFDFVPEVMVNYYVHGKSISSDADSKIKGTEMVLEKNAGEFAGRPRLLARHYTLLAVLNLLEGNPATGRSYIFRCLRLDPANWRALICLGLSFSGRSVVRAFFRGLRRFKPGYYYIIPD